MTIKRKRTDVLQELNLLDTPRTWFLWNANEQNVKEAQPSIFDAWIHQYVDTIVSVDTAKWEIFHRWGVINACINGHLLILREREDGSFLLEEKSSDSEVQPEVAMGDKVAPEAS